MAGMWTRAALEARVEKLTSEYEGAELIEAVVGFSQQLDQEERGLLGQILLERAQARTPADLTRDYPRWSVILPRPRRKR